MPPINISFGRLGTALSVVLFVVVARVQAVGGAAPIWAQLKELGVEALKQFDEVTTGEPFEVVVERVGADQQHILAVGKVHGGNLVDYVVEDDRFLDADFADVGRDGHGYLVTTWHRGVHSMALRLFDLTTGKMVHIWAADFALDWEQHGNDLVVEIWEGPRDSKAEPTIRKEIWPARH